jgi:pyruvate kinase
VKKTKIVATLGPSCSDKKTMQEMIREGVNVFRINFSHAEHETVKQWLMNIRELKDELNEHIAVMADLQGPKLRLGKIQKKSSVSPGDIFIFTTKDCEGNSSCAHITYPNFAKDVKPGERILIDDGKLLFEVISTDSNFEVSTRVIRGGKIKSKKGVNLPDTTISQPALTEKDKRDADFAIANEMDWIALSFVRTEEDVLELREYIDRRSSYKIPILAKIEKPEALKNIDRIIKVSDGILVARGDLGVEIPLHTVPIVQKDLVRKAKSLHKPVVIATQMMDSMIENPIPTRAEVNDVANSIMDGTDAVMLSGETSVGAYPVEVVKQMCNIIRCTEDSPLIDIPHASLDEKDDRYISRKVCYHAVEVANDIQAKVISTLTHTGFTAFEISAGRPTATVLAFTANKRILSMLSLLWGTKAYYYNKLTSTDETIVDINKIARERGFLEKGDYVINLTSMPIQDMGKVNTLRITEIK